MLIKVIEKVSLKIKKHFYFILLMKENLNEKKMEIEEEAFKTYEKHFKIFKTFELFLNKK